MTHKQRNQAKKTKKCFCVSRQRIKWITGIGPCQVNVEEFDGYFELNFNPLSYLDFVQRVYAHQQYSWREVSWRPKPTLVGASVLDRYLPGIHHRVLADDRSYLLQVGIGAFVRRKVDTSVENSVSGGDDLSRDESRTAAPELHRCLPQSPKRWQERPVRRRTAKDWSTGANLRTVSVSQLHNRQQLGWNRTRVTSQKNHVVAKRIAVHVPVAKRIRRLFGLFQRNHYRRRNLLLVQWLELQRNFQARCVS